MQTGATAPASQGQAGVAVPHGHAHRGTQHSDSSVSTFSFSDLRPGFVLGERERMDIPCPRLAWAAGSLGNTNHAERPWSSMISFKQGTGRKSSECSVRAGPALTPPGCVTCFLSSRRLLPQTIRASGREPQARSDCPASSDLCVSSSTCLCCFFPPRFPPPCRSMSLSVSTLSRGYLRIFTEPRVCAKYHAKHLTWIIQREPQSDHHILPHVMGE